MSNEETANTQSETDTPSEDSAPDPKKNLFDLEVESFNRTAESEGLEKTFKRFGFSLFHSLPKEDRVLYEEELGLLKKESADLYNLGGAHAAKEDYEKAVDYWKKALKADPELTDALFNIAVAYERLENLNAARKNYKQYIESIEDPAEIERVREHLSELEG